MLVVGVGNEFRTDDAAGIEAARRIKRLLPSVDVRWGEPLDLLEFLGTEPTVIIDAVVGGCEPGTIHRIDVSSSPIPPGLAASTHNLGIGDAIELARTLGRLPASISVYGIEAGSVAAGPELTPPVAEAVDAVVRELVDAHA